MFIYNQDLLQQNIFHYKTNTYLSNENLFQNSLKKRLVKLNKVLIFAPSLKK